ncbi:hypothetical protein GCM10017673_10690 [Streptosporangium violaceochromogenes]|nr:hypothetical protein GCM10017673_10690 [Streptosporangium violaceochromogenes]
MTVNTGEVRGGWWIAGIAVRAVLLAVLLWGVLTVTLSLAPSARTLAEFRFALAAGRVSTVVYQEGGGTVEAAEGGGRRGTATREVSALKWSEGPLIWHRVTPPVLDGSRFYTVERLWKEASALPPGTIVGEPAGGDEGRLYPDWPFRKYGQGEIRWIGAAWVLSLLIMLGSRPRLGNRWAWLWMFMLGKVGAILFLLLEPRPLWRGRESRLEPREPIGGGRGFLVAILLSLSASVVVSVLASGFGALLG